MPAPSPFSSPVGVFDSGVGGLSVLRALREQLPGVPLVYVADSGYAPYGERDDEYVLQRSEHITRFLLSQGARLIVIACNTATAVAIAQLRTRHPEAVFIGVEPGIKPALLVSRNGRIGVMATSGTLKSHKFQQLVEPLRKEAEIHLQACAGLAQAIEQGHEAGAAAPGVQELVERHTAPLKAAGVDTVVLGCTHYPFAAQSILEAMGPGVALVDTAEAVARHARTLYRQLPPATAIASTQPALAAPARVQAYSSGPTDALQRVAQRWLDFPLDISPLP
jgi:glutamate racemase